MPRATPTEICRTSGRACPVRCDLSRFEKCQDERQRVQLQVIALLLRGDETRQEEMDVVIRTAWPYAKLWDAGMRCPRKIASLIPPHA